MLCTEQATSAKGKLQTWQHRGEGGSPGDELSPELIAASGCSCGQPRPPLPAHITAEADIPRDQRREEAGFELSVAEFVPVYPSFERQTGREQREEPGIHIRSC